MVIGANPASNHPRLITQLVKLRERGGRVVIVNPLRETGLDRFKVPSMPRSLLFGSQVNDIYVQPRIGGDVAFLKAIVKILIEEDNIDRKFVADHTTGFEELRSQLGHESLEALTRNAGAERDLVVQVARMYGSSRNAILMWAMGITIMSTESITCWPLQISLWHVAWSAVHTPVSCRFAATRTFRGSVLSDLHRN